MIEEEDDPYHGDPQNFRTLDPEEYAALDDDAQWAYLKAWCDADSRRNIRRSRKTSPTNAPGRVAASEVEG
jgi:hypothetical protein